MLSLQQRQMQGLRRQAFGDSSSFAFRRRALPLARPARATERSSSGSSFDFDQVAKQAQVKFKELSEQAQDSAQRTWRKLDSEHQLSEKAARAARRLTEQARDVDQTFNLRRRVRSQVEHVQRMWPSWRAQLDAFSSTPVGRVTILVALAVLVSTPLFWQALNFMLLFFWLLVPLTAALIGSAQRQATEAAAAAAAAEEERRRANPFADAFRTFRSRQQGAAAATGRSPFGTQQDGPVVDAEYIVLDEDNNKGGRR